jgi:hypothetical protein
VVSHPCRDKTASRMGHPLQCYKRMGHPPQIFTNDREKLGAVLGHDVSHSSAHAPEMKPEQKQEKAVTPQREQSFDIGLGL